MEFDRYTQGGIEKTVLPCGLRVITQKVPSARSISLGLWVGVGSRDEHDHERGCAHFLEHLLFRGTPSRSSIDIANTVDAIGGEINAFTSKESTCFYAQTLPTDLQVGIDIICDVVLNGSCKKSDMETERSVILDEIAVHSDDPEDTVTEGALSGLFPTSSISFPVLGTRESLEQLTPKIVREFHAKWYQPYRMVLAATGDIEHEHLVEEVQRWFSRFPEHQPLPPRNSHAEVLAHSGVHTQQKKDGEQAHLCLGYKIGGLASPDRSTAMVLSTILGGGISSRLFQVLREEHGLAYSVYCATEFFTDVGMLMIYVACQHKSTEQVMHLLREVLGDVLQHGVKNAEVIRAKSTLQGSLILGMEELSARMFRLARHELRFGNCQEIDSNLLEIDAVQKADVNRFIRSTFSMEPSMALVGPMGKKKRRSMLRI